MSKSSENSLRFTKRALMALQLPERGRAYYRDSGCPNLQLAVTAAGNKTFYRYGKVHGRPVRVRIGEFPHTTVDQARKTCRKLSGEIADGRDPQAARQQARHEPTLGELHAHWMAVHAMPHKKSWEEDQRKYDKHLKPWGSRRLGTITKSDIQTLLATTAEKRKARKGRDRGGPYEANRLLALMRAMYGKADEIGFLGPNPTQGVRKFKETERDRYLRPDELPAFFEALAQEENAFRDFILLALLTGARKSNVLAMRWSEIGADTVWRIPDTKAGRPVHVPLVPLAAQILQARRLLTGDSPWVFPGPGAEGHLVEVRRSWARLCKRAGISDLRIHDLRRTLGSWQAATGASLPVIGKTLGHSTPGATAVYARLELDPVRQAVQKATDAILAAGNVLPLPAAEKHDDKNAN